MKILTVKVPEGTFFLQAIDEQIKKDNCIYISDKRMVSILADVCKIEDKDLRMSITNKLMEGGAK